MPASLVKEEKARQATTSRRHVEAASTAAARVRYVNFDARPTVPPAWVRVSTSDAVGVRDKLWHGPADYVVAPPSFWSFWAALCASANDDAPVTYALGSSIAAVEPISSAGSATQGQKAQSGDGGRRVISKARKRE